MTSNTIESLPNELLSNIISCLDHGDLPALCSVSRSFLNLARPLLYRSYHQDIQWPSSSILQFGRTLTANPVLGTYVRSFAVHDWDFEELEDQLALTKADEDQMTPSEADQDWRREMDAQHREMMEKLYSHSDVYFTDQKVYPNFALVLMLTQMPNLEHLRLKLRHARMSDKPNIKYALSEWNGDKGAFLPRLRTLELDWGWVYNGWSLDVFQALLDRPSLEVLYGRRCSHDFAFYAPRGRLNRKARLDNFHSGLRTIRLCHSVICEGAIHDLLEGCTGLEELCLGMSEARIGNLVELNIDRAVKAFAQRSNTLKRLLWQFEPDVHTNDSEWMGTGDFSSFSCLEWLDVPEWVLFGLDSPKTSVDDALDRLPASLSVLVIRFVEGLALQLVRQVLEHQSDRFKSLKSIALWSDTNIEEMEELEAKCTAANIIFNEERYREVYHCYGYEKGERCDQGMI